MTTLTAPTDKKIFPYIEGSDSYEGNHVWHSLEFKYYVPTQVMEGEEIDIWLLQRTICTFVSVSSSAIAYTRNKIELETRIDTISAYHETLDKEGEKISKTKRIANAVLIPSRDVIRLIENFYDCKHPAIQKLQAIRKMIKEQQEKQTQDAE